MAPAALNLAVFSLTRNESLSCIPLQYEQPITSFRKEASKDDLSCA